MLHGRQNIYLSIIVPFYNSEKKLKKCIDSILSQNSPELEILLVNDGSTDKSINICKKLKRNKKNIHIIHKKKNSGVASSRNEGIEKAKGDFLFFLDSDDYLLEGSIKKIIKLIKINKNKDLIIFKKFIAQSMKKNFITHKIFESNVNNDNVRKLIQNLYTEKKIYGNIYNYIINRSYLFRNKILFSKGISFAEDQEFVLKILIFCKKFYFSNQSFYCYRSGVGTLSSSMTYNSTLSCLKVATNLIKLKKLYFLSISKKKYINKIINKVLKQFIPRFIYLEKRKALKLSRYIKKNKNYFNTINFSFLNTEIFPIPEKNYNIKKIINFREILSNKIKKLTQADATKQIYIFCINYYGIAMMRIFKTSGFKVKGFIDNNEMLNGKRILNIKISSPKILKKINKDKKKKILIIITNQFKKNIINITEQLSKLGIDKKSIVYKIF